MPDLDSDVPAANGSLRAPLRIVVMTASLGGLHALDDMLAVIPREFPAPIVLAHHLPDSGPSYLVELLGRRTNLVVDWVRHLETLKPGHVYVGPPGFHVSVRPSGRACLSPTPRHNFSRPSGDLLFQSAAARFGGRCAAVVLSGRMRDGATGAQAVRAAGGVVIAQDPATAAAPGMPNAAIDTGSVHFVLPPRVIGDALVTVAMVPGGAGLFGVAPHQRSAA